MGDSNQRVVGACENCGRVYASIQLSDGSVRIIGQPDGCLCGETNLLAPLADDQ